MIFCVQPAGQEYVVIFFWLQPAGQGHVMIFFVCREHGQTWLGPMSCFSVQRQAYCFTYERFFSNRSERKGSVGKKKVRRQGPFP